MRTLYTALNMNTKHSTLKSVFIDNNATYCGESGYVHFSVECYDETYERAMYRDEQKLHDYINNKALAYLNGAKGFITYYSTRSGWSREYLLDGGIWG